MINNNESTSGNPGLVSEKLYMLLLRCSHALSRGWHRSGDMHPGQWRILSLLAAGNKVSQRDLLDIVQVRAASLSELLTKLEIKGLVTRTKDDDNKRTVNVEITDLGEMVVAEHTRSQQETTGELFSALSEDEQEQLVQLLSKLVNAWHEQHHGPEGDENLFHRHGDGRHSDGRQWFEHHDGHGPHGHHHHSHHEQDE